MQAALLLVLFTVLFAVMNGIIGTNDSSAQLRAQRIRETEDYFKAINMVVNTEITPNYWHGNPAGKTSITDYINNTETLKQLSPSRFADKSLDPWSTPLKGLILTRTLSIFTDGTAKVLAPVTGFLLVSAGPDKVFQTTIPTVTASTPLSTLQGVIAAGDDIVSTFTDEEAQRDQLKRIRFHAGRIAAAALQKYQADIAAYRKQRIADYQAQLATSGAIVNLDDMMEDDTGAPTFADLSVASNRSALGVDEDFGEIESGSTLTTTNAAQRGKLSVQSVANAPAKTLTVRVYDIAATSGSPWTGGTGGLLYQVTVKGN